jgi:drug/metabolite transporter (DMT)-like permease
MGSPSPAGAQPAPPPSPAFSRTLVACLLLAVAAALWGGNSVIGRALRDDISPIVLSFWRWVFTFAGASLIAGRELWQKRALVRRHLPFLALVALVGTGPNNAFAFWALKYTTSVNMQLFNSTIPLWVMLISWVGLGARAGASELVGLAVSLVGVLIIVAGGDWHNLRSLAINGGDLIILVSFFFWALYVVLIKFRPEGFSLFAFIAVLAALGALELLPFALFAAGGESAAFFPTTPRVLGGALYLGIVASLIANGAHYHGIAVVGPSRSAIFVHLVPVFGVALSALVLGEHLEPFHAAGFALVLAGLWMANRPPRAARPGSPDAG